MMFSFKRLQKEQTDSVATLQEELRKGRQEREAARLGLLGAVQRLVQATQAFPLDEQVEMVAKDLAAIGKEQEDEPS